MLKEIWKCVITVHIENVRRTCNINLSLAHVVNDNFITRLACRVGNSPETAKFFQSIFIFIAELRRRNVHNDLLNAYHLRELFKKFLCNAFLWTVFEIEIEQLNET